MSDGSVKVFFYDPNVPSAPLQYSYTFVIPVALRSTTYHVTEIDITNMPPAVHLLGVAENEVAKIICFPTGGCSMPYNASTIPISSLSHPVTAILLADEVNSMYFLVSSDTIIYLMETPSKLQVLSSICFGCSTPISRFPVDSVTGAVVAFWDRYVVLGLGYSQHPTNPGFVVTIDFNPGIGTLTYRTVTFLDSAPTTFNAYIQGGAHIGVWYWSQRIDSNGGGLAAKNAWQHSAGSTAGPSTPAGTHFAKNEYWAPGIFAIDVSTQAGLVASGNFSTPGFKLWSPTYALGAMLPEIVLRTPVQVPASTGFTLPESGHQVFGDSSQMVVSSRKTDGKYYLLLLDWSQAAPVMWAVNRDQSDTKKVQVTNFWKPTQMNLLNYNPSYSATQGDRKYDTNTSMFESMFIPPNCQASDCNFEQQGNCSTTRVCWGAGGEGLFRCCLLPPA